MKSAALRIALVLGCAAVLVTAAAFAPLALRRVSAFSVQRVLVVGTHYLSPADAVSASGITTSSNLFDDPTPWLTSLQAHPAIASATIERRVPNTIVLRVDEAVPVAFARTPELRAIDARGRVLPVDLTMSDMDLPVLAVQTRLSARGVATDEATQRVAAFISTTMRHEPGLLAWISEIGVHGDAVRLVLRNAADASVLITAQPSPARLRELHLTLADLATPRFVTIPADSMGPAVTRAAETELARVKTIDGRFHDQIVVAMHTGKS